MIGDATFEEAGWFLMAYRFSSLRTDYEHVVDLEAYWEVELDPISDDYTPREASPVDLLRVWAERVAAKYPNGLVPIWWFVQSRPEGVFAEMDSQYDHFQGEYNREPWLTQLSLPVDARTGDTIDWLTLPVVDKLWNRDRADKGGFIQSATGWKPAILQPFVYLPSLLSRAC